MAKGDYGMNYFLVTYEEAQRLIPVFEWAKKEGPLKEARESSHRILSELKDVRPIDYTPLRGHQISLSEKDYEFFIDVLNQTRGSK